MREIDPKSPVPLYHQIAQLIRARIVSGELAPGDSLEPLREAATEWDVNFHTVRHAYAELARDGLVELRGPRGTRVLGTSPKTSPKTGAQKSGPEDVESFLTEIRRRAQKDFGLSAHELSQALSRQSIEQPRPKVYALECSEHQCHDLSRQIESSWDVEAVPWCLDNKADLPPESLVATHFHYNEIRLRWPERLAEAFFVPIAPDPDLRSEVERRRDGRKDFTLTLCERDEPTAEAVAADLSVVLPTADFPLHIQVVPDPKQGLDEVEGDLILLPPRIWGSLSADQKNSRRLVEVRYLYDSKNLAETARKLTWRAAP